MGTKNMIRKTVGWCWNHAYIYHSFLQSQINTTGWSGGAAGYGSNPIYMPVLHRIISGWFNTRETLLALCARFQTGTALTGNQHLWPQGGMKWRFNVTNVTNARTRYKLYWCSLKCNDKGAVSGVFRTNYGTPFTVGTANPFSPGTTVGNDVYSPYWNFFDQSSRQPQTGDAPLVGSRVDQLHALNIIASEGLGATSTTYRAPVSCALSEVLYGAGTPNVWEIIPNTNANYPDADIVYNERLTFTFPRLARKLNVRLVAQKSIGPMQTQSFSFTSKLPSELRPEQLRGDLSDNFLADVSGFFMLKAISEPVSIKMTTGTAGGAQQTPCDYSSANTAPTFEMFSRVPVALRFRVYQEVAARSAFDAQPTFINLYGGVPTSAAPAEGTDYLVTNQGFYNDGVELVNQQALSMVHGAPAMHMYAGPTGLPGVVVPNANYQVVV